MIINKENITLHVYILGKYIKRQIYVATTRKSSSTSYETSSQRKICKKNMQINSSVNNN